MEFLYFLEKIRVPWLDKIMLLLTEFGDETIFLVVALILFWCIDKYRGYYILTVGFLGVLTNQFLKLYFRVPRPWVLDENFTILEEAREGASGYSFPSGHTQSAVGTFGGLAYTSKRLWQKVAFISIAVLVPFTRMYIGVHTPADVIVSVLIASVLIFGLYPLMMRNDKKCIPWVLAVSLFLCIAFVLYVSFFPFPADMDAHNLASGVKNAYTLLGALLGFLLVYTIDEKWLHFPVNAVWWAQVCKVLVGLALVLAVKSGTKTVLNAVFGFSAGTAIRYFLIVVLAGILWPLTFNWFSRLGKKEKE